MVGTLTHRLKRTGRLGTPPSRLLSSPRPPSHLLRRRAMASRPQPSSFAKATEDRSPGGRGSRQTWRAFRISHWHDYQSCSPAQAWRTGGACARRFPRLDASGGRAAAGARVRLPHGAILQAFGFCDAQQGARGRRANGPGSGLAMGSRFSGLHSGQRERDGLSEAGSERRRSCFPLGLADRFSAGRTGFPSRNTPCTESCTGSSSNKPTLRSETSGLDGQSKILECTARAAPGSVLRGRWSSRRWRFA